MKFSRILWSILAAFSFLILTPQISSATNCVGQPNISCGAVSAICCEATSTFICPGTVCVAATPAPAPAPAASAPSPATPTSTVVGIPQAIVGFSIPNLIGTFIKNVLGLIGVITLLMFIYAGVLWMTARGETEPIDKAKSIIIWTSAGFVAIFLSYAVVSKIISVVTTAPAGSVAPTATQSGTPAPTSTPAPAPPSQSCPPRSAFSQQCNSDPTEGPLEFATCDESTFFLWDCVSSSSQTPP